MHTLFDIIHSVHYFYNQPDSPTNRHNWIRNST